MEAEPRANNQERITAQELASKYRGKKEMYK